MNCSRRQWMRWTSAMAFGAGAGAVTGCDTRTPLVVYAAQDRVFAEPLLREFTTTTGIQVGVVYDNEATKTAGLAQRLLMERQRPRAHVWWSNEELRTRQLIAAGVLEPDLQAFGERRRVWVSPAGRDFRAPRLSDLPAVMPMARWAMAYPIFGTTAAHFLVLRHRWGTSRWQEWCRALAARRPLLLDGNSLVVRMVATGTAELGLTDSDDVRFARREGLAVEAVGMEDDDGLAIPNTVARVRGTSAHPGMEAFLRWVTSVDIRNRLVQSGALDAGSPDRLVDRGPNGADWDQIVGTMDDGLGDLGAIFVR